MKKIEEMKKKRILWKYSNVWQLFGVKKAKLYSNDLLYRESNRLCGVNVLSIVLWSNVLFWKYSVYSWRNTVSNGSAERSWLIFSHFWEEAETLCRNVSNEAVLREEAESFKWRKCSLFWLRSLTASPFWLWPRENQLCVKAERRSVADGRETYSEAHNLQWRNISLCG